jgi:uncharacterized protein YjbI with pentapeptide repeats
VLVNALLTQASLVGADLREADLDMAYADDAYMSSADLAGADFTNTVLRNARLKKANLRGTRFVVQPHGRTCWGDLQGSGWRDYLRYTALYGATYDGQTRWPSGFDPQARGAVLVDQVPGAAPPAFEDGTAESG